MRRGAALLKAITDAGEFLDVQVEWSDAVNLIAGLDWVTAAVIARQLEQDFPPLPAADELLKHRSLRALGKVTVGVELASTSGDTGV